MTAATKSKVECKASDKMPKLPVRSTRNTLSDTSSTAEPTEASAANRFSRDARSRGSKGIGGLYALAPIRKADLRLWAREVRRSLEGRVARGTWSATIRRSETLLGL